MSLPTESPTLRSAGEGGGELLGRGVAVLDPWVQRDPQWCANCGGEQTFVSFYEIEQGRVGFCLGCGSERIVAFTRTNSEVA